MEKDKTKKQIEEMEEDLLLVSPTICLYCGTPATKLLGVTPSQRVVLLCEACWKLQSLDAKFQKTPATKGRVDYLG